MRLHLQSRRSFLVGVASAISIGGVSAAVAVPALVRDVPADPIADLIAGTDDPLLDLVQRYEAGMAAFNAAPGEDTEAIEATYGPPMAEIIDHCPPATTLPGALAALRVAEAELAHTFSDMAYPLVAAARAYLERVEG
jgi:hypothetical protein